MKPAEFIERYVVEELDEKGIFPVLYLGMVDDGRASCPFVSGDGCTVYNGRPGACRAYPVGRGTTLDKNGRKQELYILVREDHCRGFDEPETHTVAEWFADQGLVEYNKINDEVLALVQHEQVGKGLQRLTREQKDKYILALYKLDEFREMVSSPAFQEEFMANEKEREAILADELSLLRFGIRWIMELLFTEKV
jgi:Fe-S-cluster containining protein